MDGGRSLRSRSPGEAGLTNADRVAVVTWVPALAASADARAYGTIDAARLWRYANEHDEIAVRHREQGHPQFWGIIAGTSVDAEESQWLLGKYKQLGLSDADIQTMNLFHLQWAPESWEVAAVGGGRSTTLTSAQPAYATTATNGKPLDVPAVYVGLGSDAGGELAFL